MDNGLHLNMFDKIYKWAVKSQSRDGFDFSTYPVQKLDTVLSKLRKEVSVPNGYKQFVPRLIKWLPDNKITQVYVQSFTDALYSLLSKKSLMIEENLSFPVITTPLSGVQNPAINDDSIISELHHGDGGPICGLRFANRVLMKFWYPSSSTWTALALTITEDSASLHST